MIARDALARELVLPFGQTQLLKNYSDLSVCNYMHFMTRDVKDPNYLLISAIVFEFLDATVI